jgi:hypothetical protein
VDQRQESDSTQVDASRERTGSLNRRGNITPNGRSADGRHDDELRD